MSSRSGLLVLKGLFCLANVIMLQSLKESDNIDLPLDAQGTKEFKVVACS